MRTVPVLPIAALLLLTACSTPLPPERAAYVGNWRNGSTSLTITAQGRVVYAVTRDNGFHKKIQAPLQHFDGDSFVVGVGPLSTTFVVSTPPHAEADGWKMTVDGLELTRTE